jgi:hypothetical protein
MDAAAAAMAHGSPSPASCADMIFPPKEHTASVYAYKENQLMLDVEAKVLSFP